MCCTPNIDAISPIGKSWPLKENADVRAVMSNSGSCASELRISSVNPSAKYSSSGPLLMATKGSTATDFSAVTSTDSAGVGAEAASPLASIAGCVSTLFANLSHTNQASATTRTTMIVRSSLRPVCAVMELSRSTSFSSLMPSGVSSNAQAKTRMSGKPSASKTMTLLSTQSGAPKFSNANSATCATTHATTT